MDEVSAVSQRYPALGPQVVLVDPSATVVLKTSVARRFWLVFGAVLLLGAGVVIFALNEGSLTGWLGVVVFVAGLLLLIVQIVRPDSLTLTRDSFSFRSLGRQNRIAWADVAEFGLLRYYVRGGVVKQVGMRMTRRSTWRRLATSGARDGFEAYLPDSYGLSVEDLIGLMEEWRLTASRQ
jgi:hypothetical protein